MARSRNSRRVCPSSGLPASNQPPPACGVPTHDARRAFATIMILMILLIMLLLALAYLRTMRVYSMQNQPYTGDMSKVSDQLIDDIGSLIGQDGKIGPANAADKQGAYEPHDYPWTCTRTNAPCTLAYPDQITSPYGLGDPQVDDAWLSPTEPESGQWAQVSNVMGSFLQYTHFNLTGIAPNPASPTGDAVPSDAPAGRAIPGMAGGKAVPFQALPTTDPRLVDTDGDGTGDALWFYPNKSLQGTTRYVAAVRIFDASSLLNLNTALGELATAPGATTGTPRKGEGPYEINAATLDASLSLPADSLTFRKAGILSLADPSRPVNGTWTNWDCYWASGAHTQNDGISYTSNRYGTADEFQLRDLIRHNAGASPTPPLFSHYPALRNNKPLRARLTTFSGVCDVRPALPYTTNRQPSWGWDLAGKRPFDLYTNQANLNVPVPPTGYPAIAGATTSPFTFGAAADTYEFHEANAASGLPDFLAGIDNANPNAGYPFPAGFNALTAATTMADRIRQYQIQMGSTAFHDALGRDNLPTSASSWMGWEPLPILTEFYAQMPYVVATTPTHTGSDANTWSVQYINTTDSRTSASTVPGSFQWPITTSPYTPRVPAAADCAAGVGSYAFELANPYAIPVRLCNLRFAFLNRDYSSAPPYGTYGNSADLDAILTAGTCLPNLPSRDAEGYFVLKPGDRIVFYRNGTQLKVPPVGFDGQPDISGLISADSGDPGVLYKVDMSSLPTATAPDINRRAGGGWYNTGQFAIQAYAQISSGTAPGRWTPYNQVAYQELNSGYDLNNCFLGENHIPDGRQGAPGDLVYKQLDVRTFGVAEKLNLLQARPPAYWNTTNTMPEDWGDWEYRTNTYAVKGDGLLTDGHGGVKPYPASPSSFAACYHNNIPGTTMPLSTNFLKYDAALSTLGKAAKVVFPGANGAHPMYGAGRQNIQNETWTWNHVGIPGDPLYPGTFPELTAAANANRTRRDNSQGGIERRDGLRPLDLLKVPLVGPIWHVPGWTGNTTYRGLSSQTPTTTAKTAGSSGSATVAAGQAGTSTSPLVGSAWQNTIGDALNFHLAKDTANLGLRGLCLRTDVPWFDWANAATQYPALPYSGTSYAIGQEALHGGDIYVAQQAGTLPAPNPTPGTGNVGASQPWGYSNGAYARASQFWQQSWGEIICTRWGVDSPKYKGNTGSNGLNWRPGLINLNTAGKDVLKCLSLPNQPGSATAVDKDAVADAILAARKNPAAGASVAGGTRKGLVLVTESLGAAGLKSHTTDTALSGGPGTSKFHTSDPNLNLDTLSWLPQQAACRSDTFIAHIVIFGFPHNNFNLGAREGKRMIVLYSRDTSGSKATAVASYTVPNQ